MTTIDLFVPTDGWLCLPLMMKAGYAKMLVWHYPKFQKGRSRGITWTWENFRRWWGTGRPGVLPSMGLQRVIHDWVTEQQPGPSTPSLYKPQFPSMYKGSKKSIHCVASAWSSMPRHTANAKKPHCVCAKSLQSCPTLCNLWIVACQASLSIGFSKQEYWSWLPFSPLEDLPNPGMETEPLMSPALAGRFFTTCAPWEAPQNDIIICWSLDSSYSNHSE